MLVSYLPTLRFPLGPHVEDTSILPSVLGLPNTPSPQMLPAPELIGAFDGALVV